MLSPSLDRESAIPVPRISWRPSGGVSPGERVAAEETPIAIVHNGSTTAVMMATPADLEDFGLGFSLSEGVISAPDDVQGLEVEHGALGIEVRLWLAKAFSDQLSARRRRLAGPTGCGLCGIESLAEALRPSQPISDQNFTVTPNELISAMHALTEAQPLGRLTRAVHAAALWRKNGKMIVREDVGRHNALDKLIGAVAREGGGADGVLLLTSRVSVEMVQKAAVLKAPILCAVSAPTALAVNTAETSGITLVGVARPDGFEVFTHAHRVFR